MAFFSIKEQPTTVSIVSEKILPTRGIKFYEANLAVLIVIPSTVDAAAP